MGLDGLDKNDSLLSATEVLICFIEGKGVGQWLVSHKLRI